MIGGVRYGETVDIDFGIRQCIADGGKGTRFVFEKDSELLNNPDTEIVRFCHGITLAFECASALKKKEKEKGFGTKEEGRQDFHLSAR
jgi:hypothetical protein